MGYEVVHTDDIPVTDLSQIDNISLDHDIRAIDEALGSENLKANVWYIVPDEEIKYHAHSELEELYYVMKGTFSLKLGQSGETETVEARPGTFWVAGSQSGHGHRNVGNEVGVVFAFGAPAVDDPGLDSHSLDSSEKE